MNSSVKTRLAGGGEGLGLAEGGTGEGCGVGVVVNVGGGAAVGLAVATDPADGPRHAAASMVTSIRNPSLPCFML